MALKLSGFYLGKQMVELMVLKKLDILMARKRSGFYLGKHLMIRLIIYSLLL